jgi:hypothetical protein
MMTSRNDCSLSSRYKTFVGTRLTQHSTALGSHARHNTAQHCSALCSTGPRCTALHRTAQWTSDVALPPSEALPGLCGAPLNE